MVVKDVLLEEHPELAADIFNAFTEAKRLYIERLKAGAIEKPTAVDELHQRVMEITGRDPLPYGIEPNRRALQEVVKSALQQKIITKPVTLEELFPASTHALVG
jgi:4,5-dihydroxyphthalate decarboxylase